VLASVTLRSTKRWQKRLFCLDFLAVTQKSATRPDAIPLRKLIVENSQEVLLTSVEKLGITLKHDTYGAGVNEYCEVLQAGVVWSA
jgi:hypothetical protein